MNKPIKNEISTMSPLFRFTLGLADDAVVLSHRLSQWCSNAPYLEEDIALSNIALDYLGRARMFYQYASEIQKNELEQEQASSEDDLAYLRNEREYTNLLIHELPKGDFAFSMVRQYFIDVFYQLYLTQLIKSSDETIAAIAAKAIKETNYHVKRSEPWIHQLLEGTDESRRRVLNALDELKDFIGELFEMPIWEQELLASGISVDRKALEPAWNNQVQALLAKSNVEFGDSKLQIRGGREGIHTEHLGHMLCEMQFLQRSYPNMQW